MKEEKYNELGGEKSELLDKSMRWWETLTLDQRQSIRWVMGAEDGYMSAEKHIEAYQKAIKSKA